MALNSEDIADFFSPFVTRALVAASEVPDEIDRREAINDAIRLARDMHPDKFRVIEVPPDYDDGPGRPIHANARARAGGQRPHSTGEPE